MKLVIAEKPSVAISIAKVIGVKNKKDGYYEGNGYKVSWCVGHLIQMANPDSYDEKYAKWNIADLPIIPNEYKYEVLKSTKKQFTTLKKLMNDKEIDTVVNACDADREGERIFRLVYNEAKCKKKMQRLWISSMEDSAIREGFDNLKDGKAYDNLFESAQARAIADWLVGMNISRLYSCLYKQNYSVGRVQTPTLSMIVTRDDEIAHFKKEKYYSVELAFDGFTLSTDRIDQFEIAEQLKNLVGETIEITDVIEKEKITKPDLLFDLTTLQRECNKHFGYSAKQTLDYAQSLYEKKLITYPRTDSRCLTEDMITSTVNNILGYRQFLAKRLAKLEYKEIPSLQDLDWRPYSINELFSVSPGKRLTNADKTTGYTPFIGATDNGNGITGFVGNDNASKDKNVLGVNYNGAPCIAFYHPYACLFTDDVKRLHLLHHEDNAYVLLFFKAIILKQHTKYSYGYKFNEQRMLRQKLQIPVNANGEPDYLYMEQYAKNMMLRKYQQYLSFLERKEDRDGEQQYE